MTLGTVTYVLTLFRDPCHEIVPGTPALIKAEDIQRARGSLDEVGVALADIAEGAESALPVETLLGGMELVAMSMGHGLPRFDQLREELDIPQFSYDYKAMAIVALDVLAERRAVPDDDYALDLNARLESGRADWQRMLRSGETTELAISRKKRQRVILYLLLLGAVALAVFLIARGPAVECRRLHTTAALRAGLRPGPSGNHQRA